MKKIAKISMLAVGAAMVTQALHADTTSGTVSDNDLLLGFTSQAAGVTQDYTVDLGQIPAGTGVQLGSIDLTTFNSVFGSALAAGQVNVGVVGAAGDLANNDLYTSTLRNGDPTTGVAGTELAPHTPTSTSINNASKLPGVLILGADSSTDTGSWTYLIAQSPTAVGTAPLGHSFSGYTGDNPLTTLGSSETLTLDIWGDTHSTTKYSYLGDIQLNVSGSTLSAVWDPAAVPEPATYSLLAGGGVLALLLRRNVKRNNA